MTRYLGAIGILVGCLATGAMAGAATEGSCPPLSMAPLALPVAREGIPYSFRVAACGGAAPVRITVASGSLPPGLAVSAEGDITGVPTVSGTFHFTLDAGDSCPTGIQHVSRLQKLTVGSGQVQPSVIKQHQLRLSVKSTVAIVPGVKPPARKVIYELASQPAETATLESPGGTFSVAGAVVESRAEPMTVPVVNGTAVASETIVIPGRVLDAARRQKAKIVYSRSFSGRQTTAVAVVDFTLD